MIKYIIILLVLLIVAGFGIKYMDIEPRIKNLITGLVIIFAVIFAIIIMLALFGLMKLPNLTSVFLLLNLP